MTDAKLLITADGSQVGREVGKVKKDISGLSKSTDAAGAAFTRLGGVVAGALSIGAVAGFMRHINQAADQLNDLSTRLGASAGNLQILQVAAEQAGGSAEAMNSALAKMSVTLGDALGGSKQANEAFARLGLSARELAMLKTDEAMERVSVALAGVGNVYERASLAQDVFGKGAKDLAGFFADAPATISGTADAIANAGAKLDEMDITKIGVMNDELALQSTIVQNLGTKFLANLAPAVGVAIESFSNLTSNQIEATDAGKIFGTVMTAAIKAIEASVQGLISWFHLWRGVGAKVFEALTSGAAGVLQTFSRAADALGLDMADSLQRAADKAAGWSAQFKAGADSAFESARRAKEAAIEAGQGVLEASAIFERATAKLEADAAAAAERAAARREAALAAAAAAQAGYDANAARNAAPTEAGKQIGSLAVESAQEKFDPRQSPLVLEQEMINGALLEVNAAYAATRLGQIEALENSTLGMMFASNQMQINAEQSKNELLGNLANSLVSTAMQAGGKLGKFGKAYAIAQTVWSTGTAIMKAMAEVPYPANIAAAAMIAAKGVTQLANIKKTNIGSGGSIVSGKSGGSGGSAPSATLPDNIAGASPQEDTSRSISQVVIQGNVFSSQETADWIIGQIRDAVESRDVVFISGNSRQAMELGG